MKKYTLYIGLNDKDSKKQEISTKKAVNTIVSMVVANNLKGCTISQSIGYYLHDDNISMVVEKSLKLELFTSSLKAIKSLISQLKEALNQESICVQISKLDSSKDIKTQVRSLLEDKLLTLVNNHVSDLNDYLAR